MASNFQVQVFTAIDRQINAIDMQINAIDSQFPAIDSQFPEIDRQINAIDKQINEIDTQIKTTKKNEKKELNDQKNELNDRKKGLNDRTKELNDRTKELNNQKKGLNAQKERLQEKLFSQTEGLSKQQQVKQETDNEASAKWTWKGDKDHFLLNSLDDNTWTEYNGGNVVYVFTEVPTENRDGVLIYDEERRLYGYITNSRTFFGEQSIEKLNENINNKSEHKWFPKGYWEVSPNDYSSSDEDENQNEENDSIADILLDLDDCSNTTIHPRFNLSSDQDIVQQFINFLSSWSNSSTEIEKLSPSVLNDRLQDFIKSAANFDPSHLLSLLEKLNKHLTLRNYPDSLMSSSTFEKSRKLLKKKVYSTKVDTFELNWECSSEQLITDSLKIVRLWLKPLYFKSLLNQFNVNFFLYAENARKISIVYDRETIKRKSYVGWSHVKRRIAGVKNRTIYLSPLFRELAQNFNEQNKDQIYRRVVFLQATCICHELGHLFIRWRLDSKLNKLDKESKMTTDQFNSPPQYSEAGNFIENRLFGGTPFAYLNQDCNKILGVGMFQLENHFKVAKQINEKFIKNLFDMSQGNVKLDPLPLLFQEENVRRNHLKRKMFGKDDDNDFGDSVNELVNITPILRIPIYSNDRNLLRKYVF